MNSLYNRVVYLQLLFITTAITMLGYAEGVLTSSNVLMKSN